jgi:hypothetical protein
VSFHPPQTSDFDEIKTFFQKNALNITKIHLLKLKNTFARNKAFKDFFLEFESLLNEVFLIK